MYEVRYGNDDTILLDILAYWIGFPLLNYGFEHMNGFKRYYCEVDVQ